MGSIAPWIRRHPIPAGSALLAVALLVHVLRSEPQALLGDSESYWILQESFGHPFALDNYTSRLRGYGFPALVRLGHEVVGPLYRPGSLTNTSSFARALQFPFWVVLLGVAGPMVARRVSQDARVTAGRILASGLIVLFFWRNDALQLLTDIPSLTLVTAGLAALLTPSDRRWVRLLTAALAGGLLGMAVDFRPAYLVGVCVAIVSLPLVGATRRQVARVPVVLAGAVLALAPQIWINVSQHGSWSPLPAASGELSGIQLQTGMELVLFGSYAGPRTPATDADMRYRHPAPP